MRTNVLVWSYFAETYHFTSIVRMSTFPQTTSFGKRGSLSYLNRCEMVRTAFFCSPSLSQNALRWYSASAAFPQTLWDGIQSCNLSQNALRWNLGLAAFPQTACDAIILHLQYRHKWHEGVDTPCSHEEAGISFISLCCRHAINPVVLEPNLPL